MVPAVATPNVSTLPLADYFFISGIESSRIFDGRRTSSGYSKSPVLDSTIEEGAHLEVDYDKRPLSDDFSDGIQSRKRFSYEPRKSISSTIASDLKELDSNRSSTTIKVVSTNGAQADNGELDFEGAMKRFADERDAIVLDLQFSAGQLAQPNKPRPKPKTQRIKEDHKSGNGIGSVKRRISTINPMSRSPTVNRRASARASRRMSNYNAVIPKPQRISTNSNAHPLKRPYEPVLLDQYPPKDKVDDTKRRAPFPDYIPMFVFPNDVNVVSADERPRSTWHGFAMTNGDGSKLYGISLIMWIPLNNAASEELELQCEEWRRRNMSSEERELANSLGERLAMERSHLSKLLIELPRYAIDTAEREAKEEEISSVEERIGMMADMLRPVRHGAASKIEGLTDVESSGLWIPRAYGVLGRDLGLTSFWKEWLRAVVVPMTNGGVLQVPTSSPRIGFWQPLERYVINLCVEAPSPITSMTQVELAIRELRLYARKEAINEIPGSRNTDLYALFRSLDVPDIVILFEYVLAESRIILLSSHTSMLHLVSAALVQLLYPLKWTGVFIPVLPARLIQALEAPCPYIVGIERRYENVELPEDDFVLVDLDQGIIEATMPPIHLPRQQRRKLVSILQLAAPHRYRFGVPLGPPKYATDAYPYDVMSSENPTIFDHNAYPSRLSHLANLGSASFGYDAAKSSLRPLLLNAFFTSRQTTSQSSDRPTTSSTSRTKSPPSPGGSPGKPSFAQNARNDSGHALQASLREKRSGFFDANKRASSIGLDRGSTNRRPSAPFSGHASSGSVSTLNTDYSGPSSYAPSVYAQSTLAASTIMPNVLMQPVHNTDTTQWVEAHCMKWLPKEHNTSCSVCDQRAEDGVYKCSGKYTVLILS